MRHFKSQAPWRDCRMWTALGSGSCVPRRRRRRVLAVAWGICDLVGAGAAAFAAGTEYRRFGSGHGLISRGSRLCLSFSWCPAEQRNADYLCTHIARLDRRIVGSELIGANWSTGRLGEPAVNFGWLCLANCVAAARFMWPDQVANVCR